MLRTRERCDADLATVVGWIPDARALYLFTGPRLTWPLTVDQLAGMTGITGFSAWIVTGDDSDPVGHFDLTVDGDVARLGRVLIDPARRGQGLAQVLIRLAAGKARALGAGELRLNVIAGNLPAVRAYERAGFTVLRVADRPDVQAMTLLL